VTTCFGLEEGVCFLTFGEERQVAVAFLEDCESKPAEGGGFVIDAELDVYEVLRIRATFGRTDLYNCIHSKIVIPRITPKHLCGFSTGYGTTLSPSLAQKASSRVWVDQLSARPHLNRP
jgi:hypothetical protein